MSRLSQRFLVAQSILFVFLLLPSTAHAQFTGAITGVVRDTSGAVLPGVTVEASSPVLIEKVRSVITDDTGQYRIVDLLTGTYTVTFALPGFSTVRRDGIEIAGTFVATVNADMKVGALEETITVTGETPVVDVQSVRVQQTVSKDVLAAIPSSRSGGGIQALIPGMSSDGDSGGITGGGGLGRANPRQPRQRFADVQRRPERRLGGRRRRPVGEWDKRRRRAGSGAQHLRRSGRGRDGRRCHERDPPRGREYVQRQLRRQRRGWLVAGEQLHAVAEGSGAAGAVRAQ